MHPLPDNDRFLNGIKKAYFLFSRQIDGSIISVSSSVKNLLGYECQEFARIFPDYFQAKYLQNIMAENDLSFFDHKQPLGYEILIHHKNGTPRWLKILELPVFNAAEEIKAFECIAHDITRHKNQCAQLVTIEKILRTALGKNIYALSETVESRDYFSHGHHQRSSSIARLIAQELGISPENTDLIRMASVVHDIGKVAVPKEILNKMTTLTEAEFSFVQCHPETGYHILKKIDADPSLAEIVLQHHERLDGSGYPGHLKGEDILLEARILAVADVIEAMGSERSYRPAIERDIIMDELLQYRGILFDPDVVDVSIHLLRAEKFIF